jgi:DNA invertase Pin-like site-specific DNA recombinase
MSKTSTQKPTEAVVYLRTPSIARGDHPPTLKRQWEVCQRYARHRGLIITRVYTDVGISGRSPRRPALDRMLHKLSHGRIGYLITADETRLARDARLRLAFELELARYGVTPISVTSP